MKKPSKFLVWLVLFSCIASSNGCQKLNLFRSQTPDNDDDEETEAKQTQMIGDYVTVAGLYPIQIEGVGLVTNLDNTGGDPAPSMYRTMLLEDMRKREVKNPNLMLQSPTTALVLVRAALPPVIQKGDTFDIEVVVPENTDATSLAGGWLMETYLAEQAVVPGRGPLKGHNMAKAKGPILISTGSGEKVSLAGVLRRGKVLGGGVYLGSGQAHTDRKLGLYLRNDFRSVRNSKRVADRIGRRFHSYEKGLKKPLSKATTDQHIELKLHPKYKDNYVRYVQVIRNITLRETPVEERDRMERLKKSILDPKLASKSALQLEAIGNESIPTLKEALKSDNFEVRFYAADALAYLGDASGVEILAEAAAKEEAFRVFALAALAILDNGETHELLKDLMNEYGKKDLEQMSGDNLANKNPLELKDDSTKTVTTLNIADPTATKTKVKLASNSSETKMTDLRHGAEARYGAFRALWTLDKKEPFIRGEKIKDEFNLHVLTTQGEPMIHLTRNRVPEVVLFGADQEFRTPIALSAGRHIVINAPAGSETVTISRFEVDKPDQERVVSTNVADIVRAVGSLGASYPDVAQMLTQAKRQSNVPGRLEIDALPQAGRYYHRPPSPGGMDIGERSKTRVGRPSLVPNMFPTIKAESEAPSGKKKAKDKYEEGTSDEPGDDEDVKSLDADPDGAGEASVTDVSEKKAGSAKKKSRLAIFSRAKKSEEKEETTTE